MFSQVQIVNNGLSKIGSARVSRLDPPGTSLERFVAEAYAQWKATELVKRRWVFATEDHYALAQVAVEEVGDGRPYKYALPVECLRPIRGKTTEWKQRGRYVYSAYEGMRVSFVKSVDETEFDPLFCEVLSCRIAVECAEFVTQSNTKKAEVGEMYKDAVSDAAKVNAFVIGPEDISSDDSDYPFIYERY